MKPRVIGLVAAAWIVAGVIWGAQTALGANLRGNPIALGMALRSSLVQSLPWIPVTLAVIYLAVRFPLSRATWRRNLGIHTLAAVVVTFFANVLVVLGFWFLSGQFQGTKALISGAAQWTLLRFHIAVLIYAAIAGLTHWIVYCRNARERALHLARLESQLARARLQALNAQIRPHFLFNTLHTIGQLWRSGRVEEADAMLDRLGSLFHKVQASTSQNEVPLSEELALVREYLQNRADAISRPIANQCSRLRSVVALPGAAPDPAAAGRKRRASWHINDVNRGRIEVESRVENGRLLLEVRDDGPGLLGRENGVSSTEYRAASSPTGTGLRNTRERIEQLYGERGSLSIDRSDGLTVVSIAIPARDTDSASA